MKFCPTCEVRLKKSISDSVLSCPTCGYTEGNTSTNKKAKEVNTASEFKVLDENESQKTLPTIKMDCDKCGYDEAVWWMLQTRGADEPTTQFYRCTKCNHTWRVYA